MRNISFSLFFLFIFGACAVNEKKDPAGNTENWKHLTGEAQGTTFSIKYEDVKGRDFSKEVKEIFEEMDRQLSTYIETSEISRLNNSDTIFEIEGKKNSYFMDVFLNARDVYSMTEGVFNPLIFPLVEYWGFGKKAEKPESIDSTIINSILPNLNYDSVELIFGDIISISKGRKNKFDFNGIAQGYTVDVIADFLINKGIKNYMIEVGGEVRAQGRNEKNVWWKLGIEKPIDENAEHELEAILELRNRAMATSGSYRRFYKKDGIRYSHTIDPKTGYPVTHSLLSVTVLSDLCWEADAYATAFMVLGKEKSIQFLNKNPALGLDVYLIYDENGKFKTWSSDGIKNLIQEQN